MLLKVSFIILFALLFLVWIIALQGRYLAARALFIAASAAHKKTPPDIIDRAVRMAPAGTSAPLDTETEAHKHVTDWLKNEHGETLGKFRLARKVSRFVPFIMLILALLGQIVISNRAEAQEKRDFAGFEHTLCAERSLP